MFLCRCSPGNRQLGLGVLSEEESDIRIAGYFVPLVPTMESCPTFPRRRRSNIVRPTTPTFLSLPEAPPPTNPVVYSPVPTMRTFNGLEGAFSAGLGALDAGWRGMESILLLILIELCLRSSRDQCKWKWRCCGGIEALSWRCKEKSC